VAAIPLGLSLYFRPSALSIDHGEARRSAGAAPGTPGSGPACVDQFSVDDCVDYALERESVVETLEDLEAARDQRSIAVGESALSSGDPVVVTAGLRLLGPFAGSNPQIADLAAPLLTSPYLTPSRLALATIRSAPKYNEIVQQYQTGHPNSEPDVDPWAAAPALDYAGVGFQGPYPNGSPYVPCDSPISIGFATNDSVDTVIARARK
jgi:hypothetical protein